jgi:hypothetical protein
MIDIRKHILHYYPTSKLEDHIFHDKGSSSETFLESILQPNSLLLPIAVSRITQNDFTTYGPALVAHFKVFDDLYRSKSCTFDEVPVKRVYKGLHAMVLIGMREGNSRFFLLQNWWKNRQFIEVSENYLEHSGTTIYFIKTPQSQIPNVFDVSHSHFAETEAVDLAEKLDDEW